jgi:hypothetical protein
MYLLLLLSLSRGTTCLRTRRHLYRNGHRYSLYCTVLYSISQCVNTVQYYSRLSLPLTPPGAQHRDWSKPGRAEVKDPVYPGHSTANGSHHRLEGGRGAGPGASLVDSRPRAVLRDHRRIESEKAACHRAEWIWCRSSESLHCQWARQLLVSL